MMMMMMTDGSVLERMKECCVLSVVPFTPHTAVVLFVVASLAVVRCTV